MPQNKNELERIKEAYKRRKKIIPPQLYSLFNTSNFFIFQQRQWDIINTLKKYNINSFESKKLLDVGCGIGGHLRDFIRYGANPENLFGIDILSDRIDSAKKLSPNIDFICGDASKLPYENETFDIVTQFTVFTSILDNEMKKSISKEMLRVLKPDGIILWYDFFMNNPKNQDVKGIKKEEIYRLFPSCKIYLRRITLAPPITRAIAPYSILACYLLEKLKIFNTHYLGIIKK